MVKLTAVKKAKVKLKARALGLTPAVERGSAAGAPAALLSFDHCSSSRYILINTYMSLTDRLILDQISYMQT